MSERVFIGLGSNLEPREATIRRAVERIGALPGTRVVRVSTLRNTAPMGVADQPDFLNGVAEIATAVAPEPLLAALLDIELGLGRVRDRRWGPRTIDLDLLLYGGRRIATESLTVPHPRLRERPFVLEPLAEIAPDLDLGEARA